LCGLNMSSGSEVEFEPWSRRSIIAGSSYAVQIGKVNGEWAVCIYRGREVVGVRKTGTLDINVLTSVVYNSMALPMSHYSIMRALSNLIVEAKTRNRPITAEAPPRPASEPAPQPPSQLGEAAAAVQPQPLEQTADVQPPPAPKIKIEEAEGEAPSPVAEVSEGMESVGESFYEFFKRSELIEEETKAAEQLVEEETGKIELKLEDIPLPERWNRSISSLLLLWGISVSFIMEKTKKKADELWSYYRDLIRKSWSKVKEKSFENVVKLFMHQCRLIGAEYDVKEFTSRSFKAEIKCLGSAFKERYKGLLNLPSEFPCIICKMRGEEIGKLYGFTVTVDEADGGCKVRMQAPPKERGEEPIII